MAAPVVLGAIPVNAPTYTIDGHIYRVTIQYKKSGLSPWEDITALKEDWRDVVDPVAQLFYDRANPFVSATSEFSGNFNDMENPRVDVKNDIQFLSSKVTHRVGANLEETNFTPDSLVRAKTVAFVQPRLNSIGANCGNLRPNYKNYMNEIVTTASTAAPAELRRKLNRLKDHFRPVFNALADATYRHDLKKHRDDASNPLPVGDHYGEDRLTTLSDDDLKTLLASFATRTAEVNVDQLLRDELARHPI